MIYLELGLMVYRMHDLRLSVEGFILQNQIVILVTFLITI